MEKFSGGQNSSSSSSSSLLLLLIFVIVSLLLISIVVIKNFNVKICPVIMRPIVMVRRRPRRRVPFFHRTKRNGTRGAPPCLSFFKMNCQQKVDMSISSTSTPDNRTDIYDQLCEFFASICLTVLDEALLRSSFHGQLFTKEYAVKVKVMTCMHCENVMYIQ
jgi:hypothetical protein